MMNVNAFWEDIISQNRNRLLSYFHDDAVIRWHCTNEQFTPTEYVSVNCDYPGKWDGTIERIEDFGSLVIIVGRVVSKDDRFSFHVCSFIRLVGDLISELDEYWSDDEEPPLWRKDKGIGKPIMQ